MNKNIPTPLAILIILLVIAVIIGISLWLCPEKETMPSQDKTTDWKTCSVDSDCVVLGKDGDCNCGCFNKNYKDWQPGGACFCAAPTSCECIDGQCEGVFGEDKTADWQTYSNLETNFTFKYPKNWEIIKDYFYETAGGIKSERRTVILQKIGDSDSNNWIRINPRQFQCSVGICVDVDGNTVATYNKEPEIQDIFNQILSTFRFINPVTEYLEGAELQYETEIQKENIATALNDILNLSEEQLKEKRYKDYTGKEKQWDLPTLIYRHFVPKPPGITLGDNFFSDVKSEEAQEQVRQVLEEYFK